MNANEFIKAHNLTNDAVFVYSCTHYDAANMVWVLKAYGATRTDFLAACAMVEAGRKTLSLN